VSRPLRERVRQESRETTYDKTVVVNRLCCHGQGGTEKQGQVVKDIHPDQVDKRTDCACCDEGDEPANLQIDAVQKKRVLLVGYEESNVI